jgi:hypothetical protein
MCCADDLLMAEKVLLPLLMIYTQLSYWPTVFRICLDESRHKDILNAGMRTGSRTFNGLLPNQIKTFIPNSLFMLLD